MHIAHTALAGLVVGCWFVLFGRGHLRNQNYLCTSAPFDRGIIIICYVAQQTNQRDEIPCTLLIDHLLETTLVF